MACWVTHGDISGGDDSYRHLYRGAPKATLIHAATNGCSHCHRAHDNQSDAESGEIVAARVGSTARPGHKVSVTSTTAVAASGVANVGAIGVTDTSVVI